jgi:translation initiation factor 2-alpha kinase 4
MQILRAMFERPSLDLIDLTYDTDVSAMANNLGTMQSGKPELSPSEGLLKAISDIRAGVFDFDSLQSIAMSASSLVSATASLRRSKNVGRIGKGGKRTTQRTAGILAMTAATSAAVTGALDGVHGADPRVVESMCSKLVSIFESHGAVHLKSPLLRPRPNHSTPSDVGGPAELLDTRGNVVLLPEDLTASFARAVGRGGAATSQLKRYDIDRVYHRSVAGGHPRETLEASFDLVHEDPHVRGCQLECEALMVVCQAFAIVSPMNSKYLTLSHCWNARTRRSPSCQQPASVPQPPM